MALSKKYKEAASKIEAGKSYAPIEALSLVKEIATANFDETVEAHFRLGIDTRQADQQLRGTVSLTAPVRRYALRFSLRATLLVLLKKLAQTLLAPMTWLLTSRLATSTLMLL